MIKSSLLEMVGGCKVCQNSLKWNVWEGLCYTVHQRLIKDDDPRLEHFTRRASHLTSKEISREEAQGYFNKTLGIGGKTLKQLMAKP